MRRGVKKNFTGEEVAWLISNYANTKNAECMERLGVSHRTMRRLATKLGLEKSPEFMRQAQRHAAHEAAIANMGGNRGAVNLLRYGKATRYRKGHSVRETMTEEQWSELHRKKGETLRETYRKERSRAAFGRQKTKLRVFRQPRATVCFRSNLRKHGYLIARGSFKVVAKEGAAITQSLKHKAENLGFIFV